MNATTFLVSLRDEVKEELDCLERTGIIEKVFQPTDWVHPVVVVRKPHGKIRLWLDRKPLNTGIKQEFYQISYFILDTSVWTVRDYVLLQLLLDKYVSKLSFGVTSAHELVHSALSQKNFELIVW